MLREQLLKEKQKRATKKAPEAKTSGAFLCTRRSGLRRIA
jgi:hypothetical protein